MRGYRSPSEVLRDVERTEKTRRYRDEMLRTQRRMLEILEEDQELSDDD